MNISDLPILFSGVSKVSRVFEQHDQVSVIGEVGKSFVFCMHFRKAWETKIKYKLLREAFYFEGFPKSLTC